MLRLFLRALKTKSCLTLVTIVLSLSLLGTGFYMSVNHALHGPSQQNEDVILTLDRGEGVRSIAQKLYAHKLIKSFIIFEIYLRFKGLEGRLQAGEYLFPRHISMMQIIDRLLQGDTLLHPILIVEGLRSQQIISYLNQNEILAGELVEDIPEGTLLPETYALPRGYKREHLVYKMRQAQQDFVQKLWDKRDPRLPYKTVQEAVVMASLIERETPLKDEKPRVAAVFLNRLHRGMRLQSDPTVIYGIYRETGEMIKSLSRADLMRQNEFNTYIINGLPPAPICHPGKDSLEAAFHPMETKDLFFVADGTGGHVFAQTYEQHQVNHQNWRVIRDRASN